MKCIYCDNLAETKDHIPPQNLFPKPKPNNLLTVPACNKCNKKFSKDDEYFKTILSISSDTEKNFEANQTLDGVLRSFNRKGRQGLINKILESSNIYENNSEEIPSYYPDKKRINNIIERITKGLIYATYNIYSDNFNINPLFQAEITQNLENQLFCNFLNELATLDFINIGNGNVFKYKYYTPADGPKGSGIWLLNFYDNITFLTIVL